ncbi:Neurogenic locus Notch protein [Araneus ventricosus]|uniref:Neurogenic locus Notch protein n=1 Tax=Araneus ventricosus TaxID=182803 RepID=A0A4Y2JJQ2_ARAVE|nr:Neurogenic locus Notch protein [Araneus ventricosus]
MCEKDPCTSSPCLNKGNCTVNGNSFKCACQVPFSGDRCEKDPCSSSPCRNGGKCKITGKGYSCDCPEDYVGERCQYGCDCKNGKCRVTSDEDVLCECLPEYGKKSEVCEPCDCGTGANCTWEGGFFSGKTKYCLCPDGSKLKEQHCEDPCTGGPCKNGGTCRVENNSFKCHCPAPFSGKNCETDPCSGGTCKNGGTCRVENNSFKCYCPAPFLGNKCETDPCTRGPCKNGGKCEVEKNSFKCYCPAPFSGKICETDPCTKNPCENGGVCRLQGNSSKCYCRTPYFGDKCQKDLCTNNPCKNGGTCSLLGDSFKCDCKDNFVGDRCEYDPCTSSPCLNNGNCTVNEHSFKCECKLPFFGDRCEKDLNLQGNHIDEIKNSQQDNNSDSITDEDTHPYQREYCTCRDGECVIELGKEVCKCPPGFGNFTRSLCKACDCGPDSNCIFITNSMFISQKVCICKPGYYEDSEKCVEIEISTVMTTTDSSTLMTPTLSSTVYVTDKTTSSITTEATTLTSTMKETSSLTNITDSSNLTTTDLLSTAEARTSKDEGVSRRRQCIRSLQCCRDICQATSSGNGATGRNSTDHSPQVRTSSNSRFAKPLAVGKRLM